MAKLIKVKMLIDTAYQGPRKEGDVVEVPADYATRWVDNGIASYVNVEDDDCGINEEDECINTENEDGQADETPEDQGAHVMTGKPAETEVTEDVDYSALKPKELYDLCVEKGLDAEPKKSKEYYIELLTAE